MGVPCWIPRAAHVLHLVQRHSKLHFVHLRASDRHRLLGNAFDVRKHELHGRFRAIIGARAVQRGRNQVRDDYGNGGHRR
jgi:hypothetical protein